MASFLARFLGIAVTALFCGLTNSSFASAADGKTLDLSKVEIVGTQEGSLPAKASALLTDEIEKRTGIRVPIVEGAQKPETPTIVIQTVAQFQDGKLPDGLEPPSRDDAYAIWVDQTQPSPTVMLLGFDERATLYAAGRLLRLLSMTKGKLELPADVRISTAPDVAIRGHQLGFRETANSYDAWDLKQYEQYLRDLIVFGANAIELIPPVSPDEPRGPLMPLHPWEMNQKLSALIGSYGMDVWMWVPVEADVNDPKQAEEELNRMRTLFQSCSHISDIFVPGGDPGHTPPDILLPWLSRMAAALHETHPDAGLWVSNQGFTPEQNEDLFNYLRTAEPDWLEGIVFGPWAKISLAEARARTPRKFRIRRYPDICHTLRCQYPVPDWDPAFCQALGREPYNPRPRAMAHIHNSLADLADGFVCYSDGITDDVNKTIWSASGWDNNLNVEEILSEYGRYFIGQEQDEAIVQGLLGLEENWRGPLLANENIEKTLAQWKEIEKQLPEASQTNWRLQLPILRANYDAYLKRRLVRHTQIEQEAKNQLRRAPKIGVKPAIDQARKTLAQVEDDDTAHDVRSKLVEQGKLLHESVRMQLDTPNYGANRPDRGAVLDYLDFSLNDSPWMEAQFAEILKLDDKQEQLRRIQQIVDWEDPGPGGYYDDLGRVGRQPHLLPATRENAWKADPGFVSSSQSEFGNRVNGNLLKLNDGKLSWLNQAETLFGKPLRMRYTNLDPSAKYRLRVTYTGRFRATMRLLADQSHEIHGPLPQPAEPWPIEFDIPQAATADGVLDLQWELLAQRGCQVAEVWLIKQ
ncbi:hypothetical protein CA54_59030 [Symmachiella macrocystis]|uniref:Beta-hexosaminidase bacterial type N-terminal domain-containing protein n=1 Tax=Symmachiella macrocystis TaxID=2527985 RepID=A0A5C6AYU4_9PLAN|nr:hypothetical protein CA54_59030 [Symmachiella macrocystis]